MQFKVPQNVQREDTIIGPITWKQLIILAIGGGIAYALYIGLYKAGYFIEVWLPPVLVVVVLTLVFAFLKIHELTFYTFLLYFLEYMILPKKRHFILGAGDVHQSLLNPQGPTPKKVVDTGEDTKYQKHEKLQEMLKNVEHK